MTTEAPERTDQVRVDQQRMDEARDRLRQRKQLTFDLGDHNELDFGSVKLAGSVLIERDLNHEDEVVVTVATPDGTILARGTGVCGWPQFKDHVDKYETVTVERIHPIAV